MSFCSELIKKKKELKHIESITTSMMGFKFIEESDDSGEVKCRKIIGPCSGFVVDNVLDLQVSQILEYLFLGSQDPAQNHDVLQEHGITHVLSVGIDVPQIARSPIKFFSVKLLDEPEVSLTNVFNSCFDFIDKTKEESKSNKIFIHCNAGFSRAPTIVIGYLMKTYGYSLNQALKMVKDKREVKPNEGFMKQLKEYENKLSASRKIK